MKQNLRLYGRCQLPFDIHIFFHKVRLRVFQRINILEPSNMFWFRSLASTVPSWVSTHWTGRPIRSHEINIVANLV